MPDILQLQLIGLKPEIDKTDERIATALEVIAFQLNGIHLNVSEIASKQSPEEKH